jgi:hypothetical protein
MAQFQRVNQFVLAPKYTLRNWYHNHHFKKKKVSTANAPSLFNQCSMTINAFSRVQSGTKSITNRK